MKGFAFNYRTKFFLVLIVVSIIAFVPMFIGVNVFIKASSDEIIHSWYENEKISIQQGNLLSSVTKLQRSIATSVLIKGVSVKDNLHRDLVSFGPEQIDFKNIVNLPEIPRGDILYYRINFYKNIYIFNSGNMKVYILTGSPLLFYLALGILLYLVSLLGIFGFIIRKETVYEEKIKSEFEIKNITLELEMSKKIGDIATQVSHDIRSPLAALKMTIGNLGANSNDDLIVMHNSIERINDIANNLLHLGKNDLTVIQPTPELVSLYVGSLISEKRIQYRQTSFQIELDSNQSYGLFTQLNVSEIKRVLSNLINNSIEAMNDRGKIEVKISDFNSSTILISIVDTGKGMPDHVLKKLGEKGFSFGKNAKDSGFGLGFSHAKETIESFKGSIEVKSVLGEGTTINIYLPKAAPPFWFVKEIIIPTSEKIFVLDDDESMIHAWEEHLPVSLLSFKNAEEFSIAIKAQAIKDFLVLIDYELLGQDKTGLDIIKNLQIEKHSILVTSHFEEKELIDQCRDLGVRIIPKIMVSLVPLTKSEVISEDFYEYVYIEDEELLRMSWQSKAKKKNIRLLALSSTKDFEQYKAKINKGQTLIYIDNNLNEGDVSGEEFAKTLHEDGYQQIFIASGYEAERFAHYPWLKFSGKNCPF